MHDARNCSKVVQASEWAKLDVIFIPFFSEVFEHDGPCKEKFQNHAESLVVQRREYFIGCDRSLWVDVIGNVIPAPLNTPVRIPRDTKPCTPSN